MKPTSFHSEKEGSWHKRIDLLFSRFAAFYGHVWRSQFKEEGFLKFAKKEWGEALQGFSDVILYKAIICCRDAYDLPPTLPQMIDCCKQVKKRHLFYVGSNSKDISYDKALAMSYLQQIRAMLA